MIEVPYLPASPGATSAADDQLRHTEYWKRVESDGLSYLRFKKLRDMEEWYELVHWLMRYLRDHTTLVGVVRGQDFQMNFYVLRASPHYEHLVTTLSRELASPALATRHSRE